MHAQARSQKFAMGGCSGAHGQRTTAGKHLELKRFFHRNSGEEQKKSLHLT